MMPTEKDESTNRRLSNRIWRGLIFLPQTLSRALILPLRWMGRRLRLEKLTRSQSVWAALVLFVVSTVAAYWQFSQPYHSHEPYSEFSTSWWIHPVESNTEVALPAITGNINAVLKAESGKLWIAGDSGLLAYSTDRGDSWTMMKFDGVKFLDPTATPTPLPMPLRNSTTTPTSLPTATPKVSPRPAATPRASPERKSAPRKKALLRFDLVPAAYAAELSDEKKPQQTPTPNPAAQQPLTNQQSGGGSDGTGGQRYPSQASPIVLNAKPSRLDFGSVQFGTSKSASVSIAYAKGTSAGITLEVAPFRLLGSSAGTNFGTTKDGCTKRILALGSSCEVTISFAPGMTDPAPPRGPISYLSAILIATPGASGPLLTIPVSGTGVDRSLSPSPSPLPSTSSSPSPTPVATPLAKPPDLTDLFEQKKNIVAKSAAAFYMLHPDDGSWLPSLPTTGLQLNTVPWPWPREIPPATIRLNVAGGAQQKMSLSTLTTAAREESSVSKATKEIAFDSDGLHGWLVGSSGVIFRTYDGGAHWYPATQSARSASDAGANYRRSFPPWYWLSVALCLVLLTPLLAPAAPTEEMESALDVISVDQSSSEDISVDQSSSAEHTSPDRLEPSIANKAVSDKPLEPGEPDALGLGAIAAGLAFFLRNDKTKPPLALGISGRWGSGKSSLMNLLKKDLEDSGSRPVWFNAWHHQKEEQLLAALLQAVKTQAVPPWSQWGGWGFHARLAFIRLQRYWLRVAVVTAAIVLIYLIETFKFPDGASLNRRLVTLFTNASDNSQHPVLEFLKQPPAPLITFFTSLAALLKGLSSALTAFGTNPASLLTTMSGGTKVKDLDAQTSFRQRFATEFADVTQALGPRHRMLILIDDLDRCRPEKVREVLEAVNFLVSSGDCFVVLGMARDIVEHCVGLSFRRVVDTLSWTSMGLSQEEIDRFIAEARAADSQGGGPSGPQDVSSQVAAKRRAFARLYLDKLIQIEVAVPEPTLLQRRLLFLTDEDQKKKSEQELRVEQVLKWSGDANRWLAPVVQAALVVLLVVGIATLAGSYALPRLPKAIASPSPSPTPSSCNQTVGGSSGNNQSSSSGSNTSTPAQSQSGRAAKSNAATSDTAISATAGSSTTPTPAPQPSPQIASVPANARLDWLSFWPLYLVGLIVMGATSSALRRVPQRDVTDTDVFVNALGIWHPLVMTCGAKNTPRTARRFQNRVRYLAMRQRAFSQGRSQSALERWLRKRFRTELPKPAPLLALPARESLARDVEEDAEKVRQLVENGVSASTTYWKVQHSPSGPDITAISNPSPLSIGHLTALLRSWIYIPEPLLVALAAIEEYEPQWLAREPDFKQFVVDAVEKLNLPIQDADSGQHVVEAVEDPRRPILSRLASHPDFFEAVKKHLELWPGWCNMALYRKAYLQLTSDSLQLRAPQRAIQPAQTGQKQANQQELPKQQPQTVEPQPSSGSPEKGSAAGAS